MKNIDMSSLLLLIFALFSLVFEGFFGFYNLVGFIIQIILVVGAWICLRAIFSKKIIADWRRLFLWSVLRLMAFFGFFMFLFVSWGLYYTVFPGKMADVLMSHGNQKILFLQMSHIATSDFYEQKKEKIKQFANQGYVVLMEGVHSGSLVNEQKFHQSLGFKFTPTLYDEIASFIGLEAQSNAYLYHNVAPSSLISVDLSVDEIISFMETGGTLTQNDTVVDIEKEIQSNIDALHPQERKFFSWFMRAFLNWSLTYSADMDTFFTNENQRGLFDVIIDKRNERIADYIINNPNQNIVVVYGALHFNGTFEILQKRIPHILIESIEPFFPYQ